jgi:hypothetical protein
VLLAILAYNAGRRDRQPEPPHVRHPLTVEDLAAARLAAIIIVLCYLAVLSTAL